MLPSKRTLAPGGAASSSSGGFFLDPEVDLYGKNKKQGVKLNEQGMRH